MSEQNWKPGDFAIRKSGRNISSQYEMISMATECDRHALVGLHWHHVGGGFDLLDDDPDGPTYRPLVVIDPQDREQVERLLARYLSIYDGMDVVPSAVEIASMQAALREFANPTPPRVYRETSSAIAPWPEVGECHSSHIEGHECPQCAWAHEHEWVAWINPANQTVGVPIRCTKCGGRKCDRDDCADMRHGHTHAEGVQ